MGSARKKHDLDPLPQTPPLPGESVSLPQGGRVARLARLARIPGAAVAGEALINAHELWRSRRSSNDDGAATAPRRREPAGSVRKKHLAMTAQERRRFIQAVLEIKRRGSYDELVALHVAMNATDFLNKASGVRIGHISPGFLPWHRQFLLEFERELQSVDPTVSVPYWDWTTDQALDSPLWADDFMGGNGRRGDRMVVTGPFAYTNGWRINTSVVPQGVPALNGHYSVDDRRFLTRDLGANIDRLPTARELEDTLALKVYDSEPFNHLAGGEVPFHSFRNHLEGYVTFPWEPKTAKLHSRGHRWSGGHMGYIASPNDPLFFLHHCFIDRCWAVWQRRHPDVPHYLPVEETDEVPGLRTLMEPWRTMTPADVVDHTAFYTYDS